MPFSSSSADRVEVQDTVLTMPVFVPSPEELPSVFGGRACICDSLTDSGASVGREDEIEVWPVFFVALCGVYGPSHENAVFRSRLSAKVETHLGTKYCSSGRMTGRHAQTRPILISIRDQIPAGRLVNVMSTGITSLR